MSFSDHEEKIILDAISELFKNVQGVDNRINEYEKRIEALAVQEKRDNDDIKSLKKYITEQKKEIISQSKRIIEQKNEVEKQQKEIFRQKEEIEKQKINLIEYIGLFVAIFTAISIDIQLLKFAQNVWQIAGLMFMVNTAPLFLFFLVKWVYKDKFEKYDFFRFLMLFGIIFLVGFIFLYVGEYKENDETEKIYSKKIEEGIKISK